MSASGVANCPKGWEITIQTPSIRTEFLYQAIATAAERLTATPSPGITPQHRPPEGDPDSSTPGTLTIGFMLLDPMCFGYLFSHCPVHPAADVGIKKQAKRSSWELQTRKRVNRQRVDIVRRGILNRFPVAKARV